MFCASSFAFELSSKYHRTGQNQHPDEGDLTVSLFDEISLQISETLTAAAPFNY
jgi:hypothetical protein